MVFQQIQWIHGDATARFSIRLVSMTRTKKTVIRFRSLVALTLGITYSSPTLSAVETTDVVPGTKVIPPVDDARADGWSTEELSVAAGERLQVLTAHFVGSKNAPERKVEEVAAADLTLELLRPSNLETVFEDPAFIIRQTKSGEKAPSVLGLGALEAQLANLTGFVKNPTEVSTKVKVFRVKENEEVVKTSAYIQTWGKCLSGTFQMNATWNCDWVVANKVMALGKITVSDYLEVIGTGAGNGSPMFSDCTEAVLGATPDFYNHLAQSMDQWLHVIEIQHHISFNAWEGVSIADVNGDGLDDLYLPQPGGLPNRLFIQQFDGTCVDHSSDSGTDWLNQSHGAVFADLDNDGDQDLVVGVHDGLIVMSNDGKGNFTTRSGLILPAAVPYSITVADYDIDGKLDIYANCYDRRSGVNRQRIFAKAMPFHDANNGGRNVMLRSEITPKEGDWKFRYVTGEVGLEEDNRRFSFSSAWEDYDNDGDLDLYVANDFGRNNLYRNDNGIFENVAPLAGVEDISAGMSVSWADYNNDGWMDIYVSNMFSSAGNRIAYQSGFQSSSDGKTKKLFQRHARGNSLFENAKDGTFRDVSLEAGVTLGRWAWGSRFVDINNDGWQDVIVANGFLTQSGTGDL